MWRKEIQRYSGEDFFSHREQEIEGVYLDEPSEYQKQFIPGKRLPYAMPLPWFQTDHTLTSDWDWYLFQKEGIVRDGQDVLLGQEIALA